MTIWFEPSIAFQQSCPQCICQLENTKKGHLNLRGEGGPLHARSSKVQITGHRETGCRRQWKVFVGQPCPSWSHEMPYSRGSWPDTRSYPRRYGAALQTYGEQHHQGKKRPAARSKVGAYDFDFGIVVTGAVSLERACTSFATRILSGTWSAIHHQSCLRSIRCRRRFWQACDGTSNGKRPSWVRLSVSWPVMTSSATLSHHGRITSSRPQLNLMSRSSN